MWNQCGIPCCDCSVDNIVLSFSYAFRQWYWQHKKKDFKTNDRIHSTNTHVAVAVPFTNTLPLLKSHIMNIACELCAHYSLYGIVRHLSCGPRHLNLLQCVCVCAMTSISGTGNKVVGTFFFHLSLIIIISIINLFLCFFVCVCERVFSVFHSLCNRTFHLADSLIILNHPTDG